MASTAYRHQLRKLLHGSVLRDISAQVAVRQQDGSMAHYGCGVWKEWLRGRLNGGRSTEALSDDDYKAFILRVEAFAASEMGVTFEEAASDAARGDASC